MRRQFERTRSAIISRFRRRKAETRAQRKVEPPVNSRAGEKPLRQADSLGASREPCPKKNLVARKHNTDSAPATGQAKGINLVVGVALLFAGRVVIFYSASSYDRGKRSLEWLTLRGELASINWYGGTSGDGGSFPLVQYRYDVDGKHYIGSNTCFGPASEATCRLGGLRTGQKIDVFVNPANPQESVLVPGPSEFGQFGLAVGGFLIIFGLIAVGSSRGSNSQKVKSGS